MLRHTTLAYACTPLHQDKLKATAWPVNLKKNRHCSQSIDIRATPGRQGKRAKKKICTNLTVEKIYHDHTTYFLLPLLFFKIFGSISQSPLRGRVKISELSLIPRAFTYENSKTLGTSCSVTKLQKETEMIQYYYFFVF